jgi:hypothetical protein
MHAGLRRTRRLTANLQTPLHTLSAITYQNHKVKRARARTCWRETLKHFIAGHAMLILDFDELL